MTAYQTSTRAMTLTSNERLLLVGQAHRVAGLLFASIVPALFWTVVARGIAHIAGITVTATALVAAGIMIAAFLGYVCAPLILRGQ
ncbi:MAG: hypothetical protein IKE66_15190 [Hyphomicrobium sp.]|nr:hypothetical protein [Hyphomicrobium sp.]